MLAMKSVTSKNGTSKIVTSNLTFKKMGCFLKDRKKPPSFLMFPLSPLTSGFIVQNSMLPSFHKRRYSFKWVEWGCRIGIYGEG